MPAGPPKGNKNAVGNSGGKEWGKGNIEKAATLKGLVMDWAIKIMQSKSKSILILKEKELVISKILPNCVPRPIEVSGEGGKPIALFNYVRNYNRHKQNKVDEEEDTDSSGRNISE